MLAVMMMSPPERRLWSALAAAVVFAALQWLLPPCRFRRDHYLGPVNIALVLMFLQLVVVPALIMLVGPESRVLTNLPGYGSMERALLLQVAAYAAFCVGLSYAAKPGGASAQAPAALQGAGPSGRVVLLYLALGLMGMAAAFGSPAQLLEYFLSEDEFPAETDSSLLALAGTFLRPFLAIGLVAWWGRVVSRGNWRRSTLAAVVAAVLLTLANMTFGFNRAAFMFPLISMLAVYSAKVRRVPFGLTAAGVAVALPLLLSLAALRSSRMVGGKAPEAFTAEAFLRDTSENLQAYAGGPQFLALFADRIGWGEKLYGGSTLLSSAMSPVPILGKGFRGGSGPALYNEAIYGIAGIEDQILPCAIELFANFHLPGLVVGFVLFGMVLGTVQEWLATAESVFAAFAIQYMGLWTAMLAAWSVSIYSQICVYFFGPVYFYIFLRHLPGLLRAIVGAPRPVAIAREVAR